MKKQATIRDVANLANVSLATVSRVLNDSSYPVSPELKQRVRDAAERLEYIPNGSRGLSYGQQRDIGLILPNITNQFYMQTMLGVGDVLVKQGYHMVLCNTVRSAKQERAFVQQLYNRGIKGIILSSVDENSDIVEEYGRKGMKFVLLDQKMSKSECSGISFDSREGARMATQYLLDQRHRDIAFATLPMNRWTRTEMYKGYQSALRAAGISVSRKLLFERMPEEVPNYSNLELEAGCMIAKEFLRASCPATAIVCINDMLAIGVIRTLMQNGVKVPEDVSVVGFDDIPFSGIFMPALTTVHCSAVEMGRLAALMLLDSFENEMQEAPVSMRLAPTLVIRDSVSQPTE